MIINFLELWQYRALLSQLVMRELKLRYRGSLLGVVWTLLNPLLFMIVYYLVFSYYMRIEMQNYSTYLFVGLLPWTWFSTAIMDGMTAITGRGDLLKKVRFPPQILPATVVFNHGINFLFSLPILAVFIYSSGLEVGWPLVCFPLIVLIQLLLTMGFAYVLSIYNTIFRDLQHLIGNLVLLWFFVTPIIYPIAMVPEKYRWTLYLNPVTILTMAYQDILFYNRWPNFEQLGNTTLVAVLLLMLGALVFERLRDDIAEII